MASRREFIKMVMLSTGATYAVGLGGCKRPSELRLLSSPKRVLASPQFRTAHAYIRDGAPLPSPSHSHTVDAVVVGAGMAGLSAAVALEDAGLSVVVVDSELRAGGAAVSQPLGGGNVPLGSVYFVDRTDELERLIKRSGVEPVICPPDGYDFGTGEIIRDLWSNATLDYIVPNVTERDGMKRFRDQMLQLGDDLPVYPLPEVLSPAMAALDIPAEEWVKQFRSQILLKILNAYSRSSEGALLGRTNVYCLQNFYTSELGDELGIPRYTFSGGTGALASGVAGTLQHFVSGHVAVRLSQNSTHVHVDCIDEHGRVVRYSAPHAVVTAQKFQLPHLIPDLPSAQKDACSQLSYAPYMTLHIVSDAPMVQPDIYDTWNLTSEFETDVVNPCSVEGTEFDKHVASLYVPMDSFARVQLQNPDLFARRAADIVDRFVSSRTPEQQDSIREIFTWGWGHGMVIPTPGSHSGIAQAARKRFGRIVFAGTDNDAAPAIENAVYNGARAAEEVLSGQGAA